MTVTVALLRDADPMLDLEARRIARMRSKIARSRAIGAEDDAAAARPYVAALVRGEEYALGSRMLAYERVGRALGRSPSWIRKLLGGTEAVRILHSTWVNIAVAYDALCAQIEAAAEHERRKEALLRSETHAPATGDPGLVASPTLKDRGGAPL